MYLIWVTLVTILVAIIQQQRMQMGHKIGVWNAHLVAGQTGLSWDSYYGDTGELADANKVYIAKLTFNDGVLSLDRNSETIKTINGPNKDDYGIFDGADSTKVVNVGL